MSRWSARFRALTPRDTIDTIDTTPPRGPSDPFVSIVSVVSKGGIGGNERCDPPSEPAPASPDVAFEAAEREAIAAEEGLPVASREAHAAALAALLRVALPPMPGSLLAGIAGAYACRACQRGIWISPSWPGPPPALCWQCEREGVQ